MAKRTQDLVELLIVTLRDAYVRTLTAIVVVSMAGVAIWGNSLWAGRFFMTAGPLGSVFVVGLRQCKREREAKKSTGELHEKVDTVVEQTNGKTLREVREAERDQLLNDDGYLGRVAEKMLVKMPCSEIAAMAADAAIKRYAESQKPHGGQAVTTPLPKP